LKVVNQYVGSDSSGAAAVIGAAYVGAAYAVVACGAAIDVCTPADGR
jgi:hypothetical protein